ncbi:MAG: histone deacetylase [Propionibacteriales bacterium]|nr:histone deacetylase [Propionibacteriales bacterium]
MDVWYVSYGSNMSSGRFAYYLAGGRPPGASHTYPGARDPSPARETAAVHLPGTVYFAGESPTWGGGAAYYDPDVPGDTPACAYLVTAQQFADIASQEMHQRPDVDHDLAAVIATGRHALGPGRYETLLRVGLRGGAPMLTFTAPHGKTEAMLNRPAPAYTAMIAAGLREAHGWDDTQVGAYLARLTSDHPAAAAT